VFTGIFDSLAPSSIDFTICNPPFFSSTEERTHRDSSTCPIRDNEEMTEGGESQFLVKMAQESIIYKDKVRWFTTMVG
jgi:23S rRNA (adenine1618-N6)-methyltransferase